MLYIFIQNIQAHLQDTYFIYIIYATLQIRLVVGKPAERRWALLPSSTAILIGWWSALGSPTSGCCSAGHKVASFSSSHTGENPGG